MPPKRSNDKSAYKSKIKSYLDKLKNDQAQDVKIDLTKVNIKTLATQIEVVREDVKLYMELLTSKRYYALNDRTINLLMEGDVDMSATTGETYEGNLLGGGEPSDSEFQKIAKTETKVEVYPTQKIRQDQVDHSFHILTLPYLIYLNMTFLK